LGLFFILMYLLSKRAFMHPYFHSLFRPMLLRLYGPTTLTILILLKNILGLYDNGYHLSSKDQTTVTSVWMK
jgi:hypothetical protein